MEKKGFVLLSSFLLLIFFSLIGTAAPPSPPAALSAVYDCCNHVDLSWTAVSEATKYRLIITNFNACGCRRVDETTRTVFVDQCVQWGTTQEYSVLAVNKFGEESSATHTSVYIPWYVPGHVPFNCPAVTLSWQEAQGRVEITWQGVGGATSYEVWRSTSKHSGYNTSVATRAVPGGYEHECEGRSYTVYDDTVNRSTTYYYLVQAINPEYETNKDGACSSKLDIPAANKNPVPEFTWSPTSPNTGQVVSFDGSSSSDPDGTIVNYAWDFDDGNTASGATLHSPSNTYAAAGTYTVLLTVTDNNGATGQCSHTIGISSPNKNPVPEFTWSPTSPNTGQVVSFDGSSSSDPDGTIVNYAWDFDDGNTASGATLHSPSNTYAAAGTYTVLLTVTDNNGATGQCSHTVSVTTSPNKIPAAEFTWNPPNPQYGDTVTFDGNSSNDPDGTITNYEWDFGGDGSASGATKQVVTHNFNAAGTYDVVLTVTDNHGATGDKTHSVTISSPANSAPIAEFTNAPENPETGDVVVFDASRSSDSDGQIAEYKWDFGDGTTDSGVAVQHSYNTASTYAVLLTVKDNDGATDDKGKVITVSPKHDLPPSINLKCGEPSCDSTGGSVDISWSATDESTPGGQIEFQYRLEGDRWSGWFLAIEGPTEPYTKLSDGYHTFYLQSRDSDEKISEASCSFVVNCAHKRDTTPPEFLTLTCGEPVCSDTGGTVSFSWSATDNVTPDSQIEYQYRLDDRRWSRWSKRTDVSYPDLPDGHRTFEVQARDKQENPTRPKSCSFYVACRQPRDRKPPRLYLDSACGTVACDGEVGTFSISWTATDDVTPASELKYSFQVIGYYPTRGYPATDWVENAEQTIEWPDLPKGEYSFSVSVMDEAGKGSAKECRFHVDCLSEKEPLPFAQNHPPEANFVWSPTSPMLGELTTFDAATATDPGGQIKMYVWIFSETTSHTSFSDDYASVGDYLAQVREEGATADFGRTVGHQFASVGTAWVELVVVDDKGARGTHREKVKVKPYEYFTMSGFNVRLEKQCNECWVADKAGGHKAGGFTAGLTWGLITDLIEDGQERMTWSWLPHFVPRVSNLERYLTIFRELENNLTIFIDFVAPYTGHYDMEFSDANAVLKYTAISFMQLMGAVVGRFDVTYSIKRDRKWIMKYETYGTDIPVAGNMAVVDRYLTWPSPPAFNNISLKEGQPYSMVMEVSFKIKSGGVPSFAELATVASDPLPPTATALTVEVSAYLNSVRIRLLETTVPLAED